MQKILFYIAIAISLFTLSYFFRSDIVDFYSGLNRKTIAGAELSITQNENEYLKKKLQDASSSDTFNDSGILEPIIANSTFFDKTNFLYGDIVLNRGEQDGVKVGALVFVAGVKPVGIIKYVYDSSSKLELFSSYKKNTEAVLTQSSTTENISLELIGDGSYGFYVKVLDSLKISVGDMLYLKNYPSLQVAKVVKIDEVESENQKVIYMSSNFNSNDSNFFFIER